MTTTTSTSTTTTSTSTSTTTTTTLPLNLYVEELQKPEVKNVENTYSSGMIVEKIGN